MTDERAVDAHVPDVAGGAAAVGAATWFSQAVHLLLWLLVGAAKTMAVVVLLTAAGTHWRDALAWLLLAFGLVAAALWWRLHRLDTAG